MESEQRRTVASLVRTDVPGEPAVTRDAGFNITGWNSSYTGQPIPEEDMREWVHATVARVLGLGPHRVLEIGCGTGLLLSRLAPCCERYVATDFSATAVEHVRRQRDARVELRHVELIRRAADDFSGIEAGAFDTIVINSVIQYFPGADYLVRVLQGAVDRVAAGGRIFIGDVRSLPLLPAYHASVQYHQATGSTLVADLRQRIENGVANEEELTVSPALFEALRGIAPRLSHVQTLLKRGRQHNELTRFRYDVVLHVESAVATLEPCLVLDWDRDQCDLDSVRSLLARGTDKRVVITAVPNARIATEVNLLSALADSRAVETVAAIEAEVRRVEGAVDPEALWELADGQPYVAEVTHSEPMAAGRMTAVYRHTESLTSRPSAVDLPGRMVDRDDKRGWGAFASDPLNARRRRR